MSTYWCRHSDVDIVMSTYWYWCRHKENQNIDLSLVFCVFRAFRRRKCWFFIGKMCIRDFLTSKILIFLWFSVYSVHSDTASGTAGWAWLGCLGGLGGRSGPRASEEQKTLKNLAKIARDFPGLYVFLYFFDLMSAKSTLFQRKCVRDFEGQPPTQPLISLSPPGPLRASSVWGKCFSNQN